MNLKDVRNVIAILSGKGGVGKSFVSAIIAIALKELGYSVGILDVDIYGSSIPWILGIEDSQIGVTLDGKLIPAKANDIAVVSFELLLEHRESPIVWRGPLKTRAIIDLLYKIQWGYRDFLVIDMPPGIGDEHLTVIHMLKPWIKGAILVLTPGNLVKHIISKTRKFLEEAYINLLGAIVNMAYFRCPHCGSIHKLYGDYHVGDVDILMEVPLYPRLSEAINNGKLIDYLYNEGKELLEKSIEICRLIVKRIG